KLKRNRVKPTRATRDKLRQQECAARSREFRAAYREARAAQLAGEPCTFPYGTYWQVRFHRVDVEPRPAGMDPYTVL
ncbi:MAG TPA: hypothetical protein VFQ53_18665, partial [Kofleriaceae bacterium]|nr:hypothetical protein [Kofleriaceae bacterium]